jgi:hypothetical protein
MNTITDDELIRVMLNARKAWEYNPRDTSHVYAFIGRAVLALAEQRGADKVAQPVGIMSRATYSTSSGAGHKQISFQFAELHDANQVLLWAKSCGAAPRPVQVAASVCSMGVGCETAGVCYAGAVGRPEMCGRVDQPAQVPLTESQVEDCIDAANRKYNGRLQGPGGQQLTTYDDPMHWLAREIERAHGIQRDPRPAQVAAPTQADGWQPMKTAPKDGTAFMALLEASDIPHAVKWCESDHFLAEGRGAGWYMTWDSTKIQPHDGPCYWMPLPAAPTREGGA